MARLKSQPQVKSPRIDAAVMRQQLDQLATVGARLRNGPLHDLLADAATAAMIVPENLNAPALARETFRPRRSSAARRHSRRDENRPHAPAWYRRAARRRRATRQRRPGTASRPADVPCAPAPRSRA